jgi:hypothetical protein
MKSRKLTCVAVLALFATVPTAMASSTWYVDGVNGSRQQRLQVTPDRLPDHWVCRRAGFVGRFRAGRPGDLHGESHH